MPRFTPSAIFACAAVLALTGCVGGPPQTVYTGRFSADSPIRLTNRTLTGGAYTVGYSMEVLLSAAGEPVTLACSVIDTSGVITGLNGMSRPVVSGQWVRIDVQNTYELPDITLGIRCVPSSTAPLTAVFRDVTLTATPSTSTSKR